MRRSIQSSVRKWTGGIGSDPVLAILATALVLGGSLAAAAAPRRVPERRDPLEALLAQDDYDLVQPDLMRELQRPGDPPCRRLADYAGDHNERVREHAVRALDDSGCTDFSSYRPYLGDTNPWVTETILRAAEHHRIGDAVPFLISLLTDRRTILTDGGSWTVGESARRVLMAVTCQSFHFDSGGTARGQTDAIAAWTSWYQAHRAEPREAWVASGIDLARDYLARDFAPHRREGFDLLAVIGAPALPALRAAFQRTPQDLRASLACAPDEPPRVTDQVPCVLLVANASRRRVALVPAPGDLEVRLTRSGESGAQPRDERPRAGHPASAGDILGRVIDLAPGEVLRREVRVGPVRGAGRYEVRVTLVDLAAALVAASPRSSPLPPIEATTVLRFEQ